MEVAILGANGYTGELLLKFLIQHPKVTFIYPASRSLAGKSIQKSISFFISKDNEKKIPSNFLSPQELSDIAITPNKIKTLFSALPHIHSAQLCTSICQQNKDIVLIDLSADFRFNDTSIYDKHYNTEHPDKKLAMRSVYGLSEWNRENIKKANIIACPGCYPTSILLPLIPIMRHVSPLSTISIVSSSGISGAGKKASLTNNFCERDQSIQAYMPGQQHRHVPEITYQLEKLAHVNNDIASNFVFTPQLVPITQGLLSIINIPLEKKQIPRAIESLQSQYLGEEWVLVETEKNVLPNLNKIRNTNYTSIGYNYTDNMLILFSAIDNLIKGAAGQAIQNFNIRFNFKNTHGLQ